MMTPYLRELRTAHLQKIGEYLRRETPLWADLIDPDAEDPNTYRALKVHVKGDPDVYTVLTCIQHGQEWLCSIADSATRLGSIADKASLVAELVALFSVGAET
jgi:hypothetical protein